ncbi:hypothetical protein Vadar_025057 [Vaccinium darrowii]|uniref:Uncharacterized protein n=1 Tax=Vaccinium darrowii TaxID=229202 RepID=A0ACB7XK12_9ERIC|nr:hypothetical protein Vadar_025057 [Vaccinium darrowii]
MMDQEYPMRKISTVFLLMMFLATEMGPLGVVVVEARLCEAASHTFKGLCLSDTNCSNVCLREGFDDGHCEGFRKRCFCRKKC